MAVPENTGSAGRSYYQWFSGRRYSDIFKAVTFEDLQKMYYTLHEADITKFAGLMDARMREFFTDLANSILLVSDWVSTSMRRASARSLGVWSDRYSVAVFAHKASYELSYENASYISYTLCRSDLSITFSRRC